MMTENSKELEKIVALLRIYIHDREKKKEGEGKGRVPKLFFPRIFLNTANVKVWKS